MLEHPFTRAHDAGHRLWRSLETSRNLRKSTGSLNDYVAFNTPNARRGGVQQSPPVIADIEDLKRVIGGKIRIAREELDMSQETLANRIGAYDYKVISAYEKGQVLPKHGRLIKIAIVLHRELAWFYEPLEKKLKNGRAA